MTYARMAAYHRMFSAVWTGGKRSIGAKKGAMIESTVMMMSVMNVDVFIINASVLMILVVGNARAATDWFTSARVWRSILRKDNRHRMYTT